MFIIFERFVVVVFLNSLLAVKGLLEIPKAEFDVLITTEEILTNTTNSIFSSLLLETPANNTRVREFLIIHQYFLSVTLQDSQNLREMARLSRVDYKNSNNTAKNLTIVINEILNEGQCDSKANQTWQEDGDANVASHVNSFLAKLETLKQSYGVNKVLSDINSNIIKLFEESKKFNLSGNEFRNYTDLNGTDIDNYTLQDSNEFWLPSGRRIYKGERTKIKYYPFMASVHIFNTFQCAGSIVKSDLIITASSCLQLAWNNRFYRENPAFLSVRVGSSFFNGGGENVPVLEIYFHPDYNPKNLFNNICMLRLLRHINFSRRNVKKIAIDKHPWNLPTNTPGITIVGWGAKGRSNKLADPWVNILSFAMLDVYPLRECQEIYSKDYVTKKNFCGGFFSKGAGACNRDVGAPGVVGGILVGVASFGSPACGTPDAPTVFTKLGYYHSWIQTILKLKVPRTKKRTTPMNTMHPLLPYQSTKITTTTFRIEPLEDGEVPSGLPFEEQDFLRTLDDKLFQEFLETMFASSEINKYKSLLNTPTKILKDGKTNNDSEEVIATTVPRQEVTESTVRTEMYIPLTRGFVDLPSTQLIPVESDAVTEHSHVTEDNIEEPDLYHPYNSANEHTSKVRKNKNRAKISKQVKSITTAAPEGVPQEIFLELATGSSDDSDQSVALQSSVNLVLSKGDSEISSSGDLSDIPSEQVIAELLDEIDLNEILNEVSTAITTSTKLLQSYTREDLQRKRYTILSSTTVTPNGYYRDENKRPDYKSVKKETNKDKNSVLTLLYLSDDEKKQNVNPYIGNVVKIKDSINTKPIEAALDECTDCSKIYNIVPKREIYKIISRVLKVAITSKV